MVKSTQIELFEKPKKEQLAHTAGAIADFLSKLQDKERTVFNLAMALFPEGYSMARVPREKLALYKKTYDLLKELGIPENALYADQPDRKPAWFSDFKNYLFTNIAENGSCRIYQRFEILPALRADFYIPEHKLAFILNDSYFQSTIFVSSKRQFELAKAAEGAGIRLVQIWNTEWQDPKMREKLKLMIDISVGAARKKIYARKCEVRQISNAEAKQLNDRIHLQGHRAAQVTYGLFYEGELVQLMSFSKTKYNRNLRSDDSWEIIRGCPGSNNIVIGGVSRLFSHFVEDCHPKSVFSYCDFNKFNGVSYEKLGMKNIGYSGPDMSWLMPDLSVHRRQPKYHEELMTKSVAQVFGAGSKKFLWTAE